MDIASETTNAAFRVPVPAQLLSLYFQLQGKPGPPPHLPVRNPFHQAAPLLLQGWPAPHPEEEG